MLEYKILTKLLYIVHVSYLYWAMHLYVVCYLPGFPVDDLYFYNLQLIVPKVYLTTEVANTPTGVAFFLALNLDFRIILHLFVYSFQSFFHLLSLNPFNFLNP